jgi:hypothetical protein
MKRLAVALLATIFLVLMASPAMAAKPTHTRTPFDQSFVDRSCGFRVGVRFVGFTVDIQWTDANGDVRDFQAYPQAKQVLTNLATGNTITTNLAGPQHLTVGADGSLTMIGTGNWGWPFNPKTDAPGIYLTAGRWVFAIDAQGNASFSIVGRIVNLCPRLAA